MAPTTWGSAMTSLEENDAEVDAAAFNALRDALGPVDLAALTGECVIDIDEACTGLEAARSDLERRSHAHKIAGLLSQYGCLKAAALALRIAHNESVDAAGLSPILVSRARSCATELQTLLQSLAKAL